MNYKDYMIEKLGSKKVSIRKVERSIKDIFGYDDNKIQYQANSKNECVSFEVYYDLKGVVYAVDRVYNSNGVKLDIGYRVDEDVFDYESVAKILFDKFLNKIVKSVGN